MTFFVISTNVYYICMFILHNMGIDKILVIIATVHAYLFAVLLLSSKRKSTKILGVYMLMTFLNYAINANMYMFKIHILNYFFYYLIPFLSLVLMPIMFLYVRYLTSETFVINKKSVVHFIPALVWFSVVIAILMKTPSEIRYNIIHEIDKESTYYESIRNLFLITNTLIFLQVFIYSIKMLYFLLKHKKTVEKVYSYKEMISLNWLMVFVSLFFAYYLFELIVFVSTELPVNISVYFLVITLHVFFVGIMGLRQREVYAKQSHEYQGIKGVQEAEENNEDDIRKTTHFSDEMKAKIAEDIKKLMQEKKIYLNPELSLYDLANELDIHKNYLSHIINDVFGMNFFNFINTYRIEHAKHMLADKQFDNFTIEGIAQSSGFKTRNVFYPIFKKIVGETPNEYKSKHKVR